MNKKDIIIIPRHSWVLVKPVEREKQTESGLVIPDSVEKERKAMGEVVKMGPEVKELEIGDKVIYGVFAGEPIQLENKDEQKDRIDFMLLHDSDILAIIK